MSTGEADLQRQAHPLAARRAGTEPSPGFADSVEEWLAALHVSHLSDANRADARSERFPDPGADGLG